MSGRLDRERRFGQKADDAGTGVDGSGAVTEDQAEVMVGGAVRLEGVADAGGIGQHDAAEIPLGGVQVMDADPGIRFQEGELDQAFGGDPGVVAVFAEVARMVGVAGGMVEVNAVEINLPTQEAEQVFVEPFGREQFLAHEEDGVHEAVAVGPWRGEAVEVLGEIEQRLVHLQECRFPPGNGFVAVTLREVEHQQAIGFPASVPTVAGQPVFLQSVIPFQAKFLQEGLVLPETLHQQIPTGHAFGRAVQVQRLITGHDVRDKSFIVWLQGVQPGGHDRRFQSLPDILGRRNFRRGRLRKSCGIGLRQLGESVRFGDI